MKKVLVIGGGLAGIGAAQALQKHGIDYALHEKNGFLGGKLETSKVDGFILDRGFQVFFEAYQKDLPKLDIRFGKFKQGAMLCYDGQIEPIDKFQPLVTLLSPAFGIKDKLLTLKLSKDARRLLVNAPEQTILEFCKAYGFSEAFIERFATPFWGGITLDRSLGQHAKKLLQSWNHLSMGSAMLPEYGMNQIASSLAKGLKMVALNSVVEKITQADSGFEVKIEGQALHFNEVISSQPWHEFQSQPEPDQTWLSSCSLWFRTDTLPILEPFLILNSNPSAFVNTVAPMSLAQPSYAPKGSHLVCVTVLNPPQLVDEEIKLRALDDLQVMFPKVDLSNWELLHLDWIQEAQISELPGQERIYKSPAGFTLIGERVTGSRINDVFLNGYEAGVKVANG